MTTTAPKTPAVPFAKPLSQIAGFPAPLAAALEIAGVRTDVSLSHRVNAEKGSHEENVRKVLATAIGTYPKEVDAGVEAVMNYLHPGRKRKAAAASAKPATPQKSKAEQELEDLGLLPKTPTVPDAAPPRGANGKAKKARPAAKGSR